jgi:hypothetical protein
MMSKIWEFEEVVSEKLYSFIEEVLYIFISYHSLLITGKLMDCTNQRIMGGSSIFKKVTG